MSSIDSTAGSPAMMKRGVLTSATLLVVLGVATYTASSGSRYSPIRRIFGSSDSFTSDAEVRRLREEFHRAFDGTENGIMVSIAGPLEERYVGSSDTLHRDLFSEDDEEDEDEEEEEEEEEDDEEEGDMPEMMTTKQAKRPRAARNKKQRNKKQRQPGKGGGGYYLAKGAKGSKGSYSSSKGSKGSKGGYGGYLPKGAKSSKGGYGSSSKGSKGGGGYGKGYPTGGRKKAGRNKRNAPPRNQNTVTQKTKRTSIFDPEAAPGRALYEANRDGSLPFIDGSATVFRRDATPLNVVEAFFPTALSESNGLFGYYWNPTDNAKIAQCAYPVDGYTLCRGKSAIDEDAMIADRCSKMIDCRDDRVVLPSTITNMDPIMCNDEESFHTDEHSAQSLRTASVDSVNPAGPTCIQQMLDKKMNSDEYRSFRMSVPWAPSTFKDSIADMSYTEVVINREQDVFRGSDVVDSEVPRAAGWVWAHAGPQLWSAEDLSPHVVDTNEEAANIRDLLCGLYHWDSDMWQPSGQGLEQSQYLLQMVSTHGYAGDKKTEEIFDVLDLGRICQ